MKKIVLTAAAFAAFAAPAFAADLPARTYKAAPVMVAPIYDWTGFYIGANGGYGWSNRCVDITAVNAIGFVSAEGCRSAGGGVAGGQIGYRWQASQWVFGLEAQGDWANLRNSRVSVFDPLATWKTNTTALGLFTGQIGYAWNASLLYFKGGAAVANQQYNLVTTINNVGIASADRSGWGGTVGVGWEYGFSPNWTAGIEYDYIWRTNDTRTLLTPGLVVPGRGAVNSISADTRADVNMITARINYRFGGPSVPHY
jgi:outer membrane immunogenic protein